MRKEIEVLKDHANLSANDFNIFRSLVSSFHLRQFGPADVPRRLMHLIMVIFRNPMDTDDDPVSTLDGQVDIFKTWNSPAIC